MLLGEHGQNRIPQIFKMIFLAQEIGVIGGQLVQHGSDHILIPAGNDIVNILGKAGIAARLERVGETAHNQRFLFT